MINFARHINLLLTLAAVFCFTQSNAQAKKDSVLVKAKHDTLKVSEYAKIVYSPDNNRTKLLTETKTQSGFYANRKVVLFPPPDPSQPPSNQQPSPIFHPSPTAQTVLIGAPGKEYYYNGDSGMTYKKKN